MGMSRIFALAILVVALLFNEWAFRFIFPLEPIDSFLRLMTLVLDALILVPIVAFGLSNSAVSEKVRQLLNHHQKSVALYVGLFFSYCLVMAVEFSCRYYFKHGYQAPYTEATYWEPSAVVPDENLGSALAKDTVITHAYVINDSLIYKQYYRTDEFGRRINPQAHPDSSYSDFLMVTGCSFAFGYGLEETHTLSYYLDSLTGKRTYNYGISGHGTQQTLAILQNRNLSNEIREEKGVLIHLFIDDHLPRLIGSRRLIKLWAQHFPYYYLDNEELKHDGSFWTGRHIQTRFFRAISQSAFIDLFDIDIPWKITDKHMRLFGAVLEESRKEFLQQYPEGRFLVVIGPNSKLVDRAKHALSTRNIDYLDLSQLLDKEQKQFKIHWTEAHPNEQYYLRVAQEIKVYLSN